MVKYLFFLSVGITRYYRPEQQYIALRYASGSALV